MTRAFRLGAFAVVCAALAILVAACGGAAASDGSAVASLDTGASTTSTSEAPGASTSSSDDPQEAFLKFSQCMRDNGVDVPDPTFDAQGRPQLQPGNNGAGQLDPNDPDVQKAMQECQQYLQGAFGGQFSEEDQQARQQALLEFAQCLRDQGLDVDDPDFSQGGGGPGGGGLFGGLDQNDPQVQDAMEQCQDILGDLGPPRRRIQRRR